MKKTKFFIFILILLILAVGANSVVLNNSYYLQIQAYNEQVYALIGTIKQNYPEVSDEEIIRILNNTNSYENLIPNYADNEIINDNELSNNNKDATDDAQKTNDNEDNSNNTQKTNLEIGKELVQKYGITENDPAILKLEETQNNTIIYSSAVIVVLVLAIIVIWLVSRIIQKRKIDGITKYIREINNRNYELKIKENAEDELSNLRNELYKITLMLKEEAENSKKDKKFLAKSLSDISHQIKTPLTSISIMLDEIKDNENMDEETRQRFIFEISRQVEQISFLTIALLKLSKLDSGTVEFEKSKYRLDELVQNAIKNLEIPLEIKNIQVETNFEVRESNKERNQNNNSDKNNELNKVNLEVIGDYRWTLEAVTNIIKNCIEHSKEHTKLYIQIRVTNVYTELIIKDEGEGIDEKDLKHIFERFYKGKNSSENSFGIGLSLSKTILEKQNASISCSSTLHKGTTFKIYFYER